MLLHLGWQGISLGLLEKSIARFQNPQSVEMALGPACGGCCYEVEGWLVNKLENNSQIEEKAKVNLDLREILIGRGKSLGISPDNIYFTRACSICDERFFSYRRQKALAGRQVSVIGGDLM